MGDYRIYKSTWKTTKDKYPQKIELKGIEDSFSNGITQYCNVLREAKVPEDIIRDAIRNTVSQQANGTFTKVSIFNTESIPIISYSFEYTILS